MILRVTCEMLRNKKHPDGYMGVSGKNTLEIVDGDKIIDSNISYVWWIGSGSPYPTPAGGPWAATYIENHPRFGRCWSVATPLETDVMIHQAVEWSMGCFIVNKNAEGNRFYQVLLSTCKNSLQVVNNPVIDSRSDADKKVNPIDYAKIGVIK